MELGLKILVYVLDDWILRVIALALGFEAEIRRTRHKQYTDALTYRHTHARIHTQTHIINARKLHMDTHTDIAMHTHIYIYIYIYIYNYIYVYIHI